MKNWFKIVVSLFLAGILILGWGYVQAQKDIALNGRYLFSDQNFRWVIDTRTGLIYQIGYGTFSTAQKDQLPK